MIAIGVPAYLPHDARCAFSLMRLASALASRGTPFDFIGVQQDPDFGHAVNGIFARFLASDATRLLLIDSDIAFGPADAICLLDSPHDYVGGNYARKGLGAGMASTAREHGARLGSLVEGEMVATGFLCLSRTALERMIAAGCPAYEDAGMLVRALVTSGPLDGQWRAGDEMLCRRWQALGEVAWIDTGVRLEHVGCHAFTEKTA